MANKRRILCIEDEPEMIDLIRRQMKADAELQHIPVVVVTAKAQSIDKVLGLHIAKVDDYVTKPFGPSDLVESVERVLRKRKELAD
jgi:two-component system response regulator VicR